MIPDDLRSPCLVLDQSVAAENVDFQTAKIKELGLSDRFDLGASREELAVAAASEVHVISTLAELPALL